MKTRNKQLKPALMIILTGILTAAGIYSYISSLKNALWGHAVTEILEITTQASHAFEVYIEKDMQILSRIVLHLQKERSGSEKEICEIIDAFESPGIAFTVTEPGRGTMYAGTDKGSRKLAKQEQQLYESFEGRKFREPYLDEYTGQEVIGGCEQFQFADGTAGIVQVKRDITLVEEDFMLSFYDDCGYSYLVNEKGDILVRSSGKEKSRDLKNILDAAVIPDGSQKEARVSEDKLTKKKEGILHLEFQGEKSIFAFTPIKGSDWYLIAVVPDQSVMDQTDDILKTSQIYAILLAAVVLAAGIILFMRFQWHKKIMEKEDDVRYREQLFDILANNTNDVFLMMKTDDYAIEYVSPNIERVLGVTQEEARGNIRVLARKRREKEEYESVRNLKTGQSAVYEGERIHKKTGEAKWFLETVYKTSVHNSERLVCVLSDRTQERRSEQALTDALESAKSANESKSIFLSNMSHDIRTPMNAITGFSMLLQRDAENTEKVREYTRKITASSQHLLGLINDVLDMSKIESGKTTLNISEISLAQLIDELGAMMQIQAKAKHQEFKIHVYDVCSEMILGDRLRINQILINILSNALKYTPENGTIEMTVRQLQQHSKNYAHFRFVIKDNGIGMSEEYLKTIFHPFSREETKKTQGIQGTGLGMAITKNLVDLMGGTLEVESTLGEGSTFVLDLELRIQEQDIDPDFWINHSVSRLLVADDDEDICCGIKRAMADTGVDIEYALGGQPAVEMTRQAQESGAGYDLVLIDWQMPDISGIETARRIRRIVPSNVPIMILTAYDISSIEEEGIAAGVDGFLQKPFFLSNFRIIVDSLKGKRQAQLAKEKDVQENGLDDAMKGLHILAAEDVELNAEILMELLKMAGADCEWAVNGQEALRLFEKSEPGTYDLILMDVQMPVMNGYEATKAIRACAHPQAQTVPVVAMTANTFSEDVKEALDAGMNAHVGKPIDMEQLKQAVAQVMDSAAGHESM